MNYSDDVLEEDIDENLSEEEFFLGIKHLNKCFLELDQSDSSNQDIKNLIEQFDELQNKVIETKNDGEYRTKELRELFRTFITLCDGRRHIYRIIELTADDIDDEDFDNRDIKFVDEITNLVLQCAKFLHLKDLQGLGEYPLQLHKLLEKLYFYYFRSFGINGSIENLFGIYYNLFHGNPHKIKLPSDIDANSKQTFFYELKEGETFDGNIRGNHAYFNFQLDKLEKKYFEEEFTFDRWFLEECNKTVVSIPPDEERFPNLAKAYRTKSPSDLPQYWANNYQQAKQNSRYNKIPIFNANHYFLISDQYEVLWNEWNKQFFDSYQQRLDTFYELLNIASNHDSDNEVDNFDEVLPEGFVYLIRNQDIYKIGITENLLNRMSQLEPDEIIDTIKCSNYREVEKELHREYKDCRIPQTEYFRLDERQVLEVSRKLRSMAE